MNADQNWTIRELFAEAIDLAKIVVLIFLSWLFDKAAIALVAAARASRKCGDALDIRAISICERNMPSNESEGVQ